MQPTCNKDKAYLSRSYLSRYLGINQITTHTKHKSSGLAELS